jgi:hypothetical protein
MKIECGNCRDEINALKARLRDTAAALRRAVDALENEIEWGECNDSISIEAAENARAILAWLDKEGLT